MIHIKCQALFSKYFLNIYSLKHALPLKTLNLWPCALRVKIHEVPT